MLGTYELMIAALSALLSLGTVVVCLRTRAFLRYILLNLYLIANVAFTAGCYYVYSVYGYSSPQYYYFYYVGDAIPNIVGYILIGSFFDRLLRDSVFHRYVRPTLMLFFFLVVMISARFLEGNLARFRSLFVAEFQQNMYFVGVLLTLLLWISMSYLEAESRRFSLLVSGLGIYFAAHAANYAFQFLFPYPAVAMAMTRVPPLAYNAMVLLWLYTFLRVPETEPAVGRAAPAREALARIPVGPE